MSPPNAAPNGNNDSRGLENLVSRFVDITTKQFEELKREIESLEKLLTGNGDKSMVTRMSLLNERVNTLDREVEKLRRLATWMALGIVGTMGGVTLNLILHFMGVAPVH